MAMDWEKSTKRGLIFVLSTWFVQLLLGMNWATQGKFGSFMTTVLYGTTTWGWLISLFVGALIAMWAIDNYKL